MQNPYPAERCAWRRNTAPGPGPLIGQAPGRSGAAPLGLPRYAVGGAVPTLRFGPAVIPPPCPSGRPAHKVRAVFFRPGLGFDSASLRARPGPKKNPHSRAGPSPPAGPSPASPPVRAWPAPGYCSRRPARPRPARFARLFGPGRALGRHSRQGRARPGPAVGYFQKRAARIGAGCFGGAARAARSSSGGFAPRSPQGERKGGGVLD